MSTFHKNSASLNYTYLKRTREDAEALPTKDLVSSFFDKPTHEYPEESHVNARQMLASAPSRNSGKKMVKT